MRYFKVKDNIIQEVTDVRLAPMTYKKLKEYGYSSDDWADWTQEQANKIVAQHEEKNNSSGKSNNFVSEEEVEKKYGHKDFDGRVTPAIVTKGLGNNVKPSEAKAFAQYLLENDVAAGYNDVEDFINSEVTKDAFNEFMGYEAIKPDGTRTPAPKKSRIDANGEANIPAGTTTVTSRGLKGSVKLKSAVLPDSVKFIDDQAFYDCQFLTSVKLNEGLESIGPASFTNCIRLSNINIPKSCKVIGADAFSYTALQEISIPEDCDIESYAFANTDIENVSIPKGVKAFSSVFNNCKKLKQADYASESLGLMFNGAPKLNTLELKEGVKRIGAYALPLCWNGTPELKELYIPASVTYIDEFAFGDYDSMRYRIDPATKAGLTISGPENTYAHKWAIKHGFNYNVV